MIVYLISCIITGKQYIGQTRQALNARWLGHCSKKSGCTYLSRAIKKYNRKNFSIVEIGRYSTQQDLNDAEEYFVDYYNCRSPNGYNLKAGGGARGEVHEDARKRQAIAQTGRKHPKETRKKMSAWQIGKIVSKETRKKLSVAATDKHYNLGKPFTKTRKRNISKALKGRKCSEQHKKAISEGHIGLTPWNKGIPHTKKTKAKLSKLLRGRKKSALARYNMREAWKKRKNGKEKISK